MVPKAEAPEDHTATPAIVKSEASAAAPAEPASAEPASAQPVDSSTASTPTTEVTADPIGETTAAQDISGPVDKLSADASRHVRSNSLKKPASFKAVSVTKNFLAKAAAGSLPGKLGSDKSTPLSLGVPSSADNVCTVASSLTGQAGGANQPPARPRLVAKTGSGLRDVAPRLTNAPAGAGRGSGPDANQVWNKNRPAQPAPPKHFTDEELKQQYGIHLATRLQADDDGKEAKWADIEDDDDDWAPETIEWNDGTKITLPQHEEPPAATSGPDAAAPQDAEAGGDAAKTQAPQASAQGPGWMAPKAGATGTAGGQKSAGLVLRGAPEKPVLVAKPPVPQAVKSPWASLPPVDRSAPVPTHAHLQQQQHQQQGPARIQPKDGHDFDARATQPSAATEIAADDFNRSWRDSHSGASRELYNSQSGRYEPVNDARRGSTRNDAQHNRLPSVLQRPHGEQAGGPAEPSPAFQTHRAPGQEAPWGRRRASSNLSGGSGSTGRRVSRGQQDMPPPQGFPSSQRRGSQAIVSEHPEPARTLSPALANPLSPTDRANSPASQATGGPKSPDPAGQQAGAQSVPATPAEDPVEMQKKIMRESRELAMKRRKEQEAKEEADRKERIRIKMEALGMPPPGKESKSERKAEPKPVELLSKKADVGPGRVSTDAGPGGTRRRPSYTAACACTSRSPSRKRRAPTRRRRRRRRQPATPYSPTARSRRGQRASSRRRRRRTSRGRTCRPAPTRTRAGAARP